MSQPIRPPKRTGPAGEYDEAVRLRTLRAVEWFGLPADKLLSFDLATLTFRAIEMVEAERGAVGAWRYTDMGDEATYTAQLHLLGSEEPEFWEFLGPPPEPARLVSIWRAGVEDLQPGMKIYNETGDVIGEVGRSIPVGATDDLGFLVT